MGPLVTRQHLEKVKGYVDLGVREGASLVVDGRELKLQGYENGNFMGGCLFDHVKTDMQIYKDEIFGPVLSVVRAKGFDDALQMVNDHAYGNGTAIFTRDGDAWTFVGKKAIAPERTVRAPVTTGDAAQWTQPTTYVQSDDTRLIAKAREIVGGETNSLQIVDKLATWVAQNMQPTFSARLSNSLEVLDSLEGDCTEHSILFVGLARAAGEKGVRLLHLKTDVEQITAGTTLSKVRGGR